MEPNTKSSPFDRLRHLMTLTSIVVPLLYFIALLVLASGAGMLFAVMPFTLAMILLMTFPSRPRPSTPPGRLTDWNTWLYVIPFVLMMNWLVDMPEYDALSDRIFAGDALWDWRILTAGLITCVRSSLIWYKRVKNLTDMEICELYES